MRDIISHLGFLSRGAVPEERNPSRTIYNTTFLPAHSGLLYRAIRMRSTQGSRRYESLLEKTWYSHLRSIGTNDPTIRPMTTSLAPTSVRPCISESTVFPNWREKCNLDLNLNSVLFLTLWKRLLSCRDICSHFTRASPRWVVELWWTYEWNIQQEEELSQRVHFRLERLPHLSMIIHRAYVLHHNSFQKYFFSRRVYHYHTNCIRRRLLPIQTTGPKDIFNGPRISITESQMHRGSLTFPIPFILLRDAKSLVFHSSYYGPRNAHDGIAWAPHTYMFIDLKAGGYYRLGVYLGWLSIYPLAPSTSSHIGIVR